ncbi:MAG: isoprenylcysteine carboxylmethyltransferase family protein [bacterium]|nr:isoprenylcysteine carboxylmethyltransferase family protein [bacterium]
MNAENAGATARTATLTYGIICYAIFFLTFLYAIGFVGNLLVPKTIDGKPIIGMMQALIVDLVLLGVFAIQHSVMARSGFKKVWTRIVPEQAERSTYTLFSSLALILLFAYWQPLGVVVWNVTNPIGAGILWAGFAFGWGLVLVSTFLINHFDLFGLRQVWLFFRKQPYTQLRFAEPWLYRVIRHPLYMGWLFAFWCTPTMTATHLVFAVTTTAYILIAIQLEEHDLEQAHKDYAAYKQRVPMLIPRLIRKQRQALP